MSRADISNFNWPTAAPGAQKFTLDLLSDMSEAKTVISATESTLQAPSAMQSADPSVQTIYVTVTSTSLHYRAANSSKASTIYQTKPLELYSALIPTKVRILVPEVTVASFNFYTSPADLSTPTFAEQISTKFKSGPTSNPSSPRTATSVSSQALSSPAIAGVTLGSVALIGVLIAIALYFYRHRNTKNHNEAEASNTGDILESKMQRARDLGRNRWSGRHTMASKERFEILKAKMAAKKVEAVVEENEDRCGEGSAVETLQVQYDRARRISGLAMHPPTPAS